MAGFAKVLKCYCFRWTRWKSMGHHSSLNIYVWHHVPLYLELRNREGGVVTFRNRTKNGGSCSSDLRVEFSILLPFSRRRCPVMSLWSTRCHNHITVHQFLSFGGFIISLILYLYWPLRFRRVCTGRQLCGGQLTATEFFGSAHAATGQISPATWNCLLFFEPSSLRHFFFLMAFSTIWRHEVLPTQQFK
jgi:hypothetical protein